MIPDSHDLRSVGADPDSKYPQRYQKKIANGVCVTGCGTSVSGRAYCYACSSKQSTYTYRSGLRHFMKHFEIDPVLDSVTLILMKEKAQTVEEHELLDKMLTLLAEGIPKR